MGEEKETKWLLGLLKGIEGGSRSAMYATQEYLNLYWCASELWIFNHANLFKVIALIYAEAGIIFNKDHLLVLVLVYDYGL